MTNTPETTATATNGEPIGNGRKRKLKPIHLAIIVVAVVAAGIFGYGKWRFITTHAATDNAYLNAPISQISPEVSAMVKEVRVKENQHVNKGDLLVVLDDSKYATAVAQAKANFAAAVADAETAGVNIDVTRLTGNAVELQAQGLVEQSVGGIKGAEADAERATAGVAAAVASQGTAHADASSAQTDISIAQLGLERANLAVSGAQAQLEGAKAGLAAAQSAVAAAKARLDYAQREATRMQGLADSGAVSSQRNDSAQTELRTAQAQYDATQSQLDSARSAVTGRQVELTSAKTQVEMARSNVAESRLRSAAARGRHKNAVAQSAVGRAQELAAKEMIAQAIAKRKQAVGQLKQAQTTVQQVAARQAMRQQALAKVAQTKAALAAAQLDLNRTRIVAPVAGIVSNKSVQPGMLLAAGTPMFSIVADEGVYVGANFKETQIERMRVGQKASISVDGFNAHEFTGTIESIAAGTGSTFALLPADNATGNFVKVVQRVTVKIVFDPGQKDLDQLRVGMSADVAVEIN